MAEHQPIADLLARVQHRARETPPRPLPPAAAPPDAAFLPRFEDWLRAMPNQVARSSLFAPIARGARTLHGGTVLVSRADGVLEYWGEQLDEADADIALQLLYEARYAALGQPVNINRAALLRAMGRCTGQHDYAWLHRRLKALTAATLIIEARRPDGATKYRIGHTKSFHILADFDYDADTHSYTFTLDPRWKVLFGNYEFALIDWSKRLAMGRGQDMAKALQRLVATSDEAVQRYALDWLKDKLHYASPVRKFKRALVGAMDELARLEIIGGGRIETSAKGKLQATWTRLPAQPPRCEYRDSVPAASG